MFWTLLEAVHVVEFLAHSYAWNIGQHTEVAGQAKPCTRCLHINYIEGVVHDIIASVKEGNILSGFTIRSISLTTTYLLYLFHTVYRQTLYTWIHGPQTCGKLPGNIP